MFNLLKGNRTVLAGVLGILAIFAPSNALAGSLPSGEREHGNVTVEPAYNDVDGSIVYLQTPNHLAPLGPTNVIQKVNPHAVAPLYLVVYPPNTPGTFNCMGVPGNCPDHDGPIAGIAVSTQPGVYGTNSLLIPGHDHLVGGHGSGAFNAPWHVYVELFTSNGAVTHITTVAQLDSAKGSGEIQEVDTGLVFLCAIVSESAYLAGTPVA
ncbi:MAG TPA: hypothetical protein VNA65_10970 [Candidatus Dormibacteraeota bacterium]|nr:hypothetical protein [Candidatus Dormibacteraeota bacterium]